MLERWMPVALTAVIALAELPARAHRRDAPSRDRGSYNLFRGALAAAFLASFLLRGRSELPAGMALGRASVWIGAGLCLGGTALRLWSIATLGALFSRVVHVSASQQVVERGPYRLIRHPAYTGTALASVGVGVSMGNALPALLIGVAFALGVAYRIRVEEAALVEALGQPYQDYMKRTKRLIPYVY